MYFGRYIFSMHERNRLCVNFVCQRNVPIYPPCDCGHIAVFLLSSNLRKRQQIVSTILAVVVCATVEYILPLHIFAVIYLWCMKLCLAKGIIIPFAYNSSESGSGHISHRNLIWLIIVFVVLCSHIHSQLHCFSLVRSTVIGGELSGDISHRNMCLLLVLDSEWHSKLWYFL